MEPGTSPSELRAAEAEADRDTEIAIVGMACRFPKAANVEAFWQVLRDGVDAVSVFSEEELAAAGVGPDVLANPGYVRAKPLLEDADRFDAAFFRIHPAEATLLDPQHRLALECAWAALEDAGWDPERFGGSIGVFAGANASEYFHLNLAPMLTGAPSAATFQALIANDKDYLPARLAYELDLRGPSMSVQTACSTGLVALTLACDALLNYQCDMALAGAVSLRLPLTSGYVHEEGGPFAPDGRCRAFDAAAAGSVFGDGVGVVVVKRLADALRDGDAIRCVVKGWAVNNDGADRLGFTAPGIDGQAAVVVQAHAAAGIEAEALQYVEAHGSATSLGDVIELTALTQAFRTTTAKERFCAVGSVKTNVGHLATAAGTAGLIKTVLALQHGLIPPSLHFSRPNPNIDFAHAPFYVNTTLLPWPDVAGPRRAGVSSFGMGGTNAHVVLEEAPHPVASGPSRAWQILPLSARTADALEQRTAALVARCRAADAPDLADVAFTLQVGRRAFAHRRVVVCGELDDGLAALADPARRCDAVRETAERSIAFLFPAAGEWWSEGAELYGTERIFREHVERAARLLGTRGERIAAVLAGDDRSLARDRVELRALGTFVVAGALAELWLSWGIRPQATMGEGVGQYAAGCLAGVLSFETAVALAAGEPCRVAPQPPTLPVWCAATGDWLTDEEAREPAFWQRASGLAAGAEAAHAWREPDAIVLVIGPGEPGAANGDATGADVRASLGPSGDPRPAPAAVLQALAGLWLAGVEVDWTAFSADERRRRVPLPTYPFERQRFWVEPRRAAASVSAEPNAGKDPDLRRWFYLPTWQRTAPIPRARPARAGRWLVFADGTIGSDVAARLRGLGHEVACVRTGARFASRGEGEYVVAPGVRADYDRLLEALPERDERPLEVAHLWSIDADAAPASRTARFEQAQERGFYSVLTLVQAIAARTDPGAVRIHAVTANAHEVTGGDGLHPEQATALGACRVIPQEYLSMRCRAVDLDLRAADGAARAALAAQLADELTAERSDPVVALRGGHRWCQVFEPLELDAVSTPAPCLRSGGVYLITGGLGRIGLTLAEHLAATQQATLLLLGRSPLPDRSTWDEWLAAHGADDPVARRIAAVQRIEGLGGKVVVHAVDVADEAALGAALDDAYARFGTIDGVIHAAGTTAFDAFLPVRELTPAACERHLRPKALGLLHLDAALAGRPLGFRIAFSSLSSVLGGIGFAAYAAGNLFMDAFAQAGSQTGGAWMAVNWDNWNLGADAPAAGGIGAGLAQFAMSTGEALSAFESLLAVREVPQVVNSTGALGPRIQRWVHLGLLGEGRLDEEGASRVTHPRPVLQTPFVPPTSELEERIAAIWRRLLGIEEVGIHDNFFELGGNSLTGVQLIAALGATLGTSIPTVALFEAPTIATLVEYTRAGGQGSGGAGEGERRGELRLELSRRLRERRRPGGGGGAGSNATRSEP
jgi:acyl transferase domain-containing protein/acyl carrier protein